jgi:hypothetical protein
MFSCFSLLANTNFHASHQAPASLPGFGSLSAAGSSYRASHQALLPCFDLPFAVDLGFHAPNNGFSFGQTQVVVHFFRAA